MMTSTEKKFYKICEEFNLSYVPNSTYNAYESKQDYVDFYNYYLIKYIKREDMIAMAEDIHFYPNKPEIQYSGWQRFNKRKFKQLIKKYNEYNYEIKRLLYQRKLEDIKRDF